MDQQSEQNDEHTLNDENEIMDGSGGSLVGGGSAHGESLGLLHGGAIP